MPSWPSAMTELFAREPNPIDVLRWKSVYDQLEALDACDEVANELEQTITVKHA